MKKEKIKYPKYAVIRWKSGTIAVYKICGGKEGIFYVEKMIWANNQVEADYYIGHWFREDGFTYKVELYYDRSQAKVMGML